MKALLSVIRSLRLFFLIPISLLVLWFLFFTTTIGLKLGFIASAFLFPVHLSASYIQGNLSQGVELENFTYETKNHAITAKYLSLTLNPSRLLTRQWKIDHLKANQVSITIKNFEPGPINRLPANFNLKNMTIKDLKITIKNNSPIFIPSLSFSGRYKNDSLNNLDLEVQYNHHALQAKGYAQLKNNGPINISAKIFNLAKKSELEAEALWHGTFNQYEVLLKGKITLNQLPISLNILGNGNLSHLSFQKIQFNTPQGVFSGNINYVWDSNIRWDGEFSTNEIHLKDLEIQPYGSSRITINTSGKVTKETWSAKLELSKARLLIPKLGFAFDNFSLLFNRHLNGTAQFSGKTDSDKGRIQLTGQSDSPRYPNHYSIKIAGKNFKLFNTSEYQVVATPNLTLHWQPNQITLNGEVLIPSADIKIKNSGESVDLPSDVVVITKKEELVEQTPFNITSDIHLTLGNDVKFQFKGMKGKLEGHLNIFDNPHQFTTALGTLAIADGTYIAYGKKLKISEGLLKFNRSPVDNPILDIKASRKVKVQNAMPLITNPFAAFAGTPPISHSDRVKVGFNIAGNLSDPTIKLFSEPAGLSQADIISYLIFDKPLSKNSQSDADILMDAVSGLSLAGGESEQVTQQIQRSFGLDELSIQSTAHFNPETQQTLNQTSLLLGKALSPRLYVNYSINLVQSNIIDTGNVLSVRYQIDKHFSVQVENDQDGNGIDLLYQVEVD
ncbi:MAG: translocation/assembly module TamB domain-containing protein [Proteobacteria bacterium]|nr:translocation/assembly module TamB domain-containing protein [Pseudomonadota bacterium]